MKSLKDILKGRDDLLSTPNSSLVPRELLEKYNLLNSKNKTLNREIDSILAQSSNANIQAKQVETNDLLGSLMGEKGNISSGQKEIKNLLQGKLSLDDFKNSYDELTDKEKIELAGQFLDLSKKEQDELLLGSGLYKKAYEIPQTGLILKQGYENPDLLLFKDTTPNEITIEDYLSNKHNEELLRKKISKKASPLFREEIEQMLEKPQLVAIPEKSPILLQKKLITPNELTKNIKLDNLPLSLDDRFKNIIDLIASEDDKEKAYLSHEYRPRDLHGLNLGMDPDSKKIKAFDAMPSVEVRDKILPKEMPKFEKLLAKLKDPTLFKSIAPVLKMGGKVGIPLAAAYSNYSEAKEAGLPEPLAAGYAAAEELNPLPISGLDYYRGMEDAAEGKRKIVEDRFKKIDQLLKKK